MRPKKTIKEKREAHRIRCAKYRADNPLTEEEKDARRIYDRDRHLNKTLEQKEANRIRCAKWREDNPEKERALDRAKYEKNRDKILASSKVRYEANADDIKEHVKEYRKTNADKIKDNKKEYYKANTDKIKEYHKEYRRNRRAVDPLYKLTSNIRRLISISLKNRGFKKTSKTATILGCSFMYLQLHLKLQFEDWMNWGNQGKYNGEINFGWDIDHIIPISSAETEEEVLSLSHYSNLQPLCSHINRNIKRDRLYYIN